MTDPVRLDAVARILLKNRYPFLPVLPNSKGTREPRWTRLCNSLPNNEAIEHWLHAFPNYGVGIVCGPISVVGIDIDSADPVEATTIEALVTTNLGKTIRRVGRSPRILLCYRVNGAAIRRRKIGKVDILGTGSYFVAFGTHPDTRQPYQWIDGSPLDTPVTDLPSANAEQIEALCAELAAKQGFLVPEKRAFRSHANVCIQTGVIRCPTTGRVIDSRDEHLTQLTWAAYCRGHTTAVAIADDAWEVFIRTTDLKRHKKDGDAPWDYADALVKARYVLASEKPRAVSSCIGTAPYWTEPRKRQFAAFVALYVAQQSLPRSLVAVSNAMLGFLLGNDVCAASVDTLAKLSHLQSDSLKAVRRQLVRHRLWSPSNNLGGAYKTAEYAPVRNCLNADPKTRR